VRALIAIGLALAITGLVITFAGNTGRPDLNMTAVLIGGVLFVLGGTMTMTALRVNAALRRQARAEREHPDGPAGPTGT
jgi:uncharacterized membrane protein